MWLKSWTCSHPTQMLTARSLYSMISLLLYNKQNSARIILHIDHVYIVHILHRNQYLLKLAQGPMKERLFINLMILVWFWSVKTVHRFNLSELGCLSTLAPIVNHCYYRLMPYIGKSKLFSATNCKQIKDSSNSSCSSTESGVYWVLNKQVPTFVSILAILV